MRFPTTSLYVALLVTIEFRRLTRALPAHRLILPESITTGQGNLDWHRLSWFTASAPRAAR